MYRTGATLSCCSGSAFALMGVLTVANAEGNSNRAVRIPQGEVKEATYTSPSGVYSVTIAPDPPSAYRVSGSESALYEFSENGKQVWSQTIPFTLRGVVVTDKGLIAGIAHTIEKANSV